jgi:ATP-dependent helicase HrpA
LPFAAANRKAIAQVQELEHKSRRQDVLVDDELIYDFYAQQIPADVYNGHTFERWYRSEVRRQPRLLMLTRDELMRHEAAGITGMAFPKQIRLGGIDCAGSLPARTRRSEGWRHRHGCRSTRSTRRARSVASGWCPAC